MERCSYFIEDKALFGSFPSQETVNLLEKEGVRCFIDLTSTHEEEKTIPYKTNYRYIKYPIADRKIPENWKSFAQLIIAICRVIQSLLEGEKVYIHCKGGHGRSGILVACILCYLRNFSPTEAIQRTTEYHSQRVRMREKMRKLGSPQGKSQKHFVYKFFHPLFFSKPIPTDFLYGLDNASEHTVFIEGVGLFPTAYLALQYYRCPENAEYVKSLLEGRIRRELVHHKPDWDEKKIGYMEGILERKFRQHANLKNNLMSTGLRPFVKLSSDPFWGSDSCGRGGNNMGKIYSRLREKFLLEDFYTGLKKEK